jgi:hypothetical protein
MPDLPTSSSPTIKRQKPRKGQHAISEARRRIFLSVLSQTGLILASAKAASPFASEQYGAASSFKTLRQTDAKFALDWDAAIEIANERLEAEAIRRGAEGVKEKIYQGSEQVFNADGSEAYVTKYSDKLLLRILAVRMRRWRETSDININDSRTSDASKLYITAADLISLSESDRRSLSAILHKLQVSRGDAVDVAFSDAEIGSDEPLAIEDRSDEDHFNSLPESEQADLLEILS